MDKNRFWSIDKLIPGVGGASFPLENKSETSTGVSILSLSPEEQNSNFGPSIRPKGSRVIRSFALTEPIRPRSRFWEAGGSDFSNPPFAPCTLYSPNFSGLTPPQRRYLFFFFRAIEERRKVPTAFPYLQLYLCKTVCESRPSGVIPQDFYWVWKTYREDFPLADKLFADTLSDFSFLCGTSIGYEALGEILTERSFTARPFLLNAYLFDHLFKEGHVFTPKEIDLVLRTMTGESFRKAKAYRFHPKFPYVVEEAVAKAVRYGLFSRRDLNENLFHIQIPSEVRVERRLFQGLPEKEVPMAEISLRYVPYLHDENIRSRIDELIRYLENRIRKILKIKNSLSRIHISALHQGFLEGILAEYEYLAPREDAEESKIDAPLPSPPREIRIDFEEAAKIEEESRRITSELTRSYTSADADSVILGDHEDEVFDKRYEKELAALEIAGGGDENGFWELASTLSEAEDSFMRVIVHQGSSEARRFCAASGVFFEAMVSSCNEKAMDACDDAVIDGAGSVYEDYLDTLKSVFPPME